MADNVIRKVDSFKVKYSDVFHLKNLYVMMHEYLADEGWYGQKRVAADNPSNSHRDIEKLYMERYHQKALHRGGRELWVWWRLTKQPYGKGQTYYEYRLAIDFHIMYLVDQEIIHQGKKMKINKGEIEIFFRPEIVRTATGESWSKHWFLKRFQDVFERRVWSEDFDKMEKELWREAYRLQGVVKAYLNLRNFIPVPEPFHPKLWGYEGDF